MNKRTFQQKELCEIAEISSGNSAPQGLEHFAPMGYGIPFVRMQDLGRYGKTPNLTEVADFIKEATSKKLKVFPAGSILIPKSGASIRLNHRAILGVNAHVVSHLAIIQAKPSYVLNKYLYYWLHTIDFSDKAHDSDLPSLKLSDLANLEVPVPSLEVQNDIISTLEEIDDLRQKQRKAIELTRQMIPVLFYEMFGDPVINSMGWNIVKLGDYSSKIGSGATPRGGDSSYKTEGISLIRSLNVRDGEFRWKDLARIDDAQASKLSNVIIEENDVLLNITGASVARVCCVPKEVLPARVNQHVCIIRTTSKIQPRFLESLLLTISMKNKLLRIGQSGATREAITKSQVLALKIPLPPIELQKTFSEKAQECLSLLEHQEQSLQKLDVLFETTLNQFFSQSTS